MGVVQFPEGGGQRFLLDQAGAGAALGIQQPLLVRPAGDTFEIVAGRRRFFALRALRKDGETVAAVPCAIMDETDDAAVDGTVALPPFSAAQRAAGLTDWNDLCVAEGLEAVRRALHDTVPARAGEGAWPPGIG